MNNKLGKKDPFRLKFDISKTNLQCFITQTPSHSNSDNTLLKDCPPCLCQNTKGSNTENIPRVSNLQFNHCQEKGCCKVQGQDKRKNVKQEFKNQQFLTSVLTQVFTQEFADLNDIKELVLSTNVEEEDDKSVEKNSRDVELLEQSREKNTKEDSNVKMGNKVVYEGLFTQKIDPSISVRQGYFQQDSEYRALLNECEMDFKFEFGFDKANKKYELQHQTLQKFPQTNHNINRNFVRNSNQNMNQDNPMPNNEQNPYPTEFSYNSLPYYQSSTYLAFRIEPQNLQSDGRTTLMIRNIPNKYTHEMLSHQFDRNHRHKYNFFYLPIDFSNSCNVGYAFVNFIHTKFIKQFFQEFNGKRWGRFNSEKVCQLAYARVQGSAALVWHFRNVGSGSGRKGVQRNYKEVRRDLSRIVEHQKQQNCHSKGD